jgi:7-cyano-7-deazaguanine synthase
VVLLSGGLDSATVLAIARGAGLRALRALVLLRPAAHFELEAARRVAASIGVAAHRIAEIDLRVFGGSALTGDIDVPKGRTADEMAHGIPITYVPARNTIFLSFALAWAEVLGSSDIFIGVNALDYSGYPDCRPEFIEAFEKMANLATKAGVEGRQALKIHTPLIALTKAQIIAEGNRVGRGLRADQQLLRSIAYGRAVRAMRFVPAAAKGLSEKMGSRPVVLSRKRGFQMSYAVKEIFYTLQGEGAQAGRAAVFCRFAGCNLWSGREADRAAAICNFCDTDFVGVDGPGGGRFDSAKDLAALLKRNGLGIPRWGDDLWFAPAESPCCKWMQA